MTSPTYLKNPQSTVHICVHVHVHVPATLHLGVRVRPTLTLIPSFRVTEFWPKVNFSSNSPRQGLISCMTSPTYPKTPQSTVHVHVHVHVHATLHLGVRVRPTLTLNPSFRVMEFWPNVNFSSNSPRQDVHVHHAISKMYMYTTPSLRCKNTPRHQ